MVADSAAPRALRPWERWSQNTQRTSGSSGERLALVVPDGHLLGVAVREHDRERRVRPPHLLHVQGDPVVGPDGADAVGGQREERLGGLRVGAQPRAADGVALGCQPQADAERGDADRPADQPRPGSPHAYVRGTRAPTRVTIS
jgi:hypothetical protein